MIFWLLEFKAISQLVEIETINLLRKLLAVISVNIWATGALRRRREYSHQVWFQNNEVILLHCFLASTKGTNFRTNFEQFVPNSLKQP